LFIASFYDSARKNADLPSPKSKRTSIIVLGLLTSLNEVGTSFPYYVVIGIKSTSDLSSMEWVSIILGYNVIIVTPPLYFIYLLFGRWIHSFYFQIINRKIEL
jgi:hypothetical protein